MDSEFILENYRKYLISSGTCKTDRSLRDYLLSLDMFSREVKNPLEIKDYREFHWSMESLASRTEWPDGRSKKHWKLRTVHKVSNELSVFYEWAYAFKFTEHRPLKDGHKFGKAAPEIPEYFDWDDPNLKKLLYDPKNSAKKTAIYQVIRASGMRPMSCSALKISDYEDGVLKIRKKGGGVQWAPLDAEATEALNYYLRCLKLHYNGEWLFPREDFKGPLTAHAIWKQMYQHGKRLGVHFYPRKLRHSAGAEWAALGKDALTIAEGLGHADPKTTKIYFHLSKKKMQSFYAEKKG